MSAPVGQPPREEERKDHHNDHTAATTPLGGSAWQSRDASQISVSQLAQIPYEHDGIAPDEQPRRGTIVLDDKVDAEKSYVLGTSPTPEGETPPARPSSTEPPSHGRLLPLGKFLLVYACLSVCVLLTALDQTIVACIVPSIASKWGFRETPWVGMAYLLTQTVFAPVYGRMSDVFGRKPVFIVSQLIFLAGTAMCGAAPSMLVLIFGRAIAGVGGAGLFSLVHICVSDIVTLRKRGTYHGILSAVNGAGSALGPIIGGLFASRGDDGWRMAFYFQLPIAGVAAIATAIFLPQLGKSDRRLLLPKLKTIDYLGTVLFITGCVFFLLSLNLLHPPETPFTAPIILGFCFGGIGLLVLFLLWEWKGATQPLIPLKIFRNIPVDIVFCLNFVFGYCFYGTLYYVPLLLQLDGQSVVQSSLALLPVVVSAIVLSWASGLATSIFGAYMWSLVIAFALMLSGSIMLFNDTRTSLHTASIIPTMLILGIGFGMQMQNTLVACQSATRQKDVAMATSVRNFWRNQGGVWSLAIGGVLVHATLPERLRAAMGANGLPSELMQRIEADPGYVRHLPLEYAKQAEQAATAYKQALQLVFFIFVPLAVIGFLGTLVLPEFSLDRSQEGEPIRSRTSSGNPIHVYRALARRLSADSNASDDSVGGAKAKKGDEAATAAQKA